MQRICVYCGASLGRNEYYRRAAQDLGQELAKRGLHLVYGGGSVGLMGVLADAVLAAGGQVFGVIPRQLATELAHRGVTSLKIVSSMHERKACMAELADAFIALPGGYGTFEELFETITWSQLGIHRKPVGLLNTAGYFDLLVSLIDKAIEEAFIVPENRALVVVADSPAELLDRLCEHRLPPVLQLIRPEES
ncbi:MAG: TIGR00730 family Rossman fold protein [Acidobacteriota bacterium]